MYRSARLPCDAATGACPGRFDWVRVYFQPGTSFDYDWWVWVYLAGAHGAFAWPTISRLRPERTCLPVSSARIIMSQMRYSMVSKKGRSCTPKPAR